MEDSRDIKASKRRRASVSVVAMAARMSEAVWRLRSSKMSLVGVGERTCGVGESRGMMQSLEGSVGLGGSTGLVRVVARRKRVVIKDLLRQSGGLAGIGGSGRSSSKALWRRMRKSSSVRRPLALAAVSSARCWARDMTWVAILGNTRVTFLP